MSVNHNEEDGNLPLSGEDVRNLAQGFIELNKSLIALRTEFSKYRTRVRWYLAVGVAIIVTFIGLASVQAIVSRSTSDVVTAIESCTTPGGECYDRSMRESDKRTAPFVSLICNATPPASRQPPCPDSH